MTKAPTSTANGDEVETSPLTKKRPRSRSKPIKSQRKTIELEEYPVDQDEEDDSGVFDSNFAKANYFVPAPSYPHTPFGSPYSYPSMATYNPFPYGFGASPSPKPSKSKSSKTSQRRSSNAMNLDAADAYHEKTSDDDDNNEWEENDELDEEEQIPRAKRPKLAKEAQQWYPQANHAYGPIGLQTPSMSELPLGYQSGYGMPQPSAPPQPHWWHNTHNPWSQQPPQHQDNATLWAYYYYGYAMGQYDSMNLIAQKKRSSQ
jgi:hypothetical protein